MLRFYFFLLLVCFSSTAIAQSKNTPTQTIQWIQQLVNNTVIESKIVTNYDANNRPLSKLVNDKLVEQYNYTKDKYTKLTFGTKNSFKTDYYTNDKGQVTEEKTFQMIGSNPNDWKITEWILYNYTEEGLTAALFKKAARPELHKLIYRYNFHTGLLQDIVVYHKHSETKGSPKIEVCLNDKHTESYSYDDQKRLVHEKQAGLQQTKEYKYKDGQLWLITVRNLSQIIEHIHKDGKLVASKYYALKNPQKYTKLGEEGLVKIIHYQYESSNPSSTEN